MVQDATYEYNVVSSARMDESLGMVILVALGSYGNILITTI